MAKTDDWLLTPHKVVDQLFEECGVSGTWRERAGEFFEREIQQESVMKKIPWLNETPLYELKQSQVVKYRGMIQDMFDPEFYLDLYQVRDGDGRIKFEIGRYKDVAECLDGQTIIADSHECVTGDRQLYYCVPIPGETEWVKEVYQEQNLDRSKSSTSVENNRMKRGAEDEDDNDSMDMDDGSETKKIRKVCEKGERQPTTTTTNTTPVLNFPLPDMKGPACLVKVYGKQTFSLNDVVEVVGILSVDPSLGSVAESDGMMEMDEEIAHSPPPSLVPRLHVLHMHRMEHTNPLIMSEPQTVSLNHIETREILRNALVELFLGDELTADFVICHLVSSVYLRKDALVLGKYAINISNISQALQDQEYGLRVFRFLSSLVTQAHYHPLTRESLNTSTFVPKKDYKSNRLMSGLLQLPQHTHLVLDETHLSVGQIDTKGMENLSTIGSLLASQRIHYDFQFHNIHQETNIPIMILSEGRSMIPCDAEIKLEPRHTDVQAAFERAEEILKRDSERILGVRIHLSQSRILPYTLSDSMQKIIEEDFVETRRNSEEFSADDLHNLLILARLLSLSCGESSLNQDIWRSAKILERERKARVSRRAQ